MTPEEVKKKIEELLEEFHDHNWDIRLSYAAAKDLYTLKFLSLIPEVLEGLLPNKYTEETNKTKAFREGYVSGYNDLIDQIKENIQAWKGK